MSKIVNYCQLLNSVNYYNSVRSNFMKDNAEDIQEMKKAVEDKQSIEILSGCCNGMVIKTKYDIHIWIEKHVEDTIGKWDL